jgi:hypothetical protein
MKYNSEKNIYPFLVNPFGTILPNDHKYETNSYNILFKKINKVHKNRIFCCLATDVLKYAISQSYEESEYIKQFYPLLYKADILDLNTLEQRKHKIYVEYNEKKTLYLENDQKIVALNKIYLDKNITIELEEDEKSEVDEAEAEAEDEKSEVDEYESEDDTSEVEVEEAEDKAEDQSEDTKNKNFINNILNIEFKIKSLHNNTIPLDIIFKNIHSTIKMPLIKLIPANKMENIYRLYTDKISYDGTKIPFLSKLEIKKKKEIGKIKKQKEETETKTEKKGVYYFIKENNIEIIIGFKEDMSIITNIKMPTPQSINFINKLTKRLVQPLIDEINTLIEETGFKLLSFVSLQHDTVDIIDLTYNLIYPNIIQEYILRENVLKNINLLLSVFDVIENNIENQTGILLIYKRVSNYNQNNFIKAFINNLKKKSIDKQVIISELATNLNLSNEDSIIEVDKYYEDKSLNDIFPGLLTSISFKKPSNSKLDIKVFGLNNLNYLKTIDIYLQSIFYILFSNQTLDTTILTQFKTADKNKLLKEIGFGVKDEDEEDEDEEDEDEDEDEDDVDVDVDVEEEPTLDPELEASPLEDSEIEDSEIEDSEIEDSEPEEIEDSEPEEIEAEPEIEPEPVPEDSEPEPEPIPEESEIEASDIEEPEPEPEPVPEESESLQDSIPEVIPEPEPVQDSDVGSESGSESGSDSSEFLKRYIGGAKVGIEVRNYFTNRMKEKDPTLNIGPGALKKQGINEYGRTCQSSKKGDIKRQPIILDQKEKKKIDKLHPGSYKDSVEYNTPTGEKFWYICPRYWDLHNNVSLTEETAKSKEYADKILGKSDSKTSANKFILYNELYEYPYLLNKDEYYPPCCGKKKIHKLNKLEQKKDENYILSYDKENLDQNRLAYLPIAVATLLKQKQSNAHTLEPQKIYLLRQGVEKNENQSFIGVLADLYKTDKKQYTIEEMKQEIINKVNIDTFMGLQNGSLISIFNDKNIAESEESSVLDSFKSSILYKNTDMNNILQKKVFINIANSYSNFIRFIKSQGKIDYSYLWDLISKKNGLFVNGVNLIILELVNDDMTDKINIICPSNYFSSEPYTIKKDTVIIIKQDNTYEPIYSVEYNGDAKIKKTKKKTDVTITKFFKKTKTMSEINNVIYKIFKNVEEHCAPQESQIKKYEFIRNKPLKEVFEILTSLNYKIVNQVLNYNGKVIALIIKLNSQTLDTFYIPCYPSNILIDMVNSDIKIIWISDVKWNTYNKTKEFLETLYQSSNEKISCKPVLKVIETDMIVGIITKTNQYIKIEPPEDYKLITDNLPSINYKYIDVNLINNDYIKADIVSLTSKKSKDMSDLNKINFEKKLYNSFRNTIRSLLSNIKIKITTNYIQTILAIIKSSESNYFEKNEAIIQELKSLTSKYITFIDISYDEYKSNNSDEIKSCVNNIKCKNTFFCEYDEENKICKLKIPKNNLFSNTSNEKYYYERIADELIRYNRIRDFIFSQRSFLNFSYNKYNLNPNELLIIESKLNDDFFNNLVPINIYNTDVIPYDIVNPNNLRKNKILKELTYKDFESKENEFEFKFPDPSKSLSTRFIPNSKTINKLLDQELEEQKNKTQPVQPAQPAQPAKLSKLKILTKKSTKIIDEDKELENQSELPIKKTTQIETIGPANFINCTNEIELANYTYFNEPMKCKDYNIINSVLCSYQLITELINNNITNTNTNTDVSLTNIINNLIKKYTELFKNEKYKQIILSLWTTEGNYKQELSEKLAQKKVNIDDILTENTYFITTTDIMLLADIYKIPLVLFSTEPFNEFNIKIEPLNIYFLINKEKKIKLLTTQKNPIKLTKATNTKYYYVYVSKIDGILNYKLFYNSLDEFKLSETVVISEFINSINTSTSYINTILS